MKYYKSNKPEVLDSRVEGVFREKQWEIIWTPPYCPKFQPIELVWGVGKQRAATLYKPGRTMKETKEHLRRGWYGGVGSADEVWAECNVAGCWRTAMGEIDQWIAKDNVVNPGQGVTGNLANLGGVQEWMMQDLGADEVTEDHDAAEDDVEEDGEGEE